MKVSSVAAVALLALVPLAAAQVSVSGEVLLVDRTGEPPHPPPSPLPGVEVRLFDLAYPEPVATGTTDGTGRFSFTHRPERVEHPFRVVALHEGAPFSSASLRLDRSSVETAIRVYPTTESPEGIAVTNRRLVVVRRGQGGPIQVNEILVIKNEGPRAYRGRPMPGGGFEPFHFPLPSETRAFKAEFEEAPCDFVRDADGVRLLTPIVPVRGDGGNLIVSYLLSPGRDNEIVCVAPFPTLQFDFNAPPELGVETEGLPLEREASMTAGVSRKVRYAENLPPGTEVRVRIPGPRSVRLPRLSCRVLDGTRRHEEGGAEVPFPGATVEVVRLTEESLEATVRATSGEDGESVFEGVALPEGPYAFRVVREGVPYTSDEFEVKEGAGAVSREVTTYAATTSRDSIVISHLHWVLEPHGSGDRRILLVQEIASVENRGARTFVGGGGEHGFTYRFRPTPGAAELRSWIGNFEVPTREEGGFRFLHFPLEAHRTTSLALTYVLSLEKGHHIPFAPPYPVERLNVVVENPDDAGVVVEGLGEPQRREAEGKTMEVYSATGLGPEEAVRIRVRGPSRLAFYALLGSVVLGAVGIAALATGTSRRRRARRTEEGEILRRIARLDLDFEKGRIPRERYEAERGSLLARAMEARTGRAAAATPLDPAIRSILERMRELEKRGGAEAELDRLRKKLAGEMLRAHGS